MYVMSKATRSYLALPVMLRDAGYQILRLFANPYGREDQRRRPIGKSKPMLDSAPLGMGVIAPHRALRPQQAQ